MGPLVDNDACHGKAAPNEAPSKIWSLVLKFPYIFFFFFFFFFFIYLFIFFSSRTFFQDLFKVFSPLSLYIYILFTYSV